MIGQAGAAQVSYALVGEEDLSHQLL